MTQQPAAKAVPHSEVHRRDVLRSAAAICSAAWMGRSAVGNDGPGSCLLGFSTYGTKSLKTEAAITMIDRIGFDSVELAVWSDWDADSAAMSKERRAAVRSQIADSGLVLTSLMEHVPPTNDKKHQHALQRLNLAAELAHDLCPDDPPLIQTVLGGGDFEASKTQLRDRLGEWVDLANRHDVTIAIKPHRGGVVSQPSEAVWLFEQLNRPQRLRMVYDYSHYAFRDLSIDDTVRMSIPFTSHIAVKDAVQQGTRVVFQLPGEAGTIDFSRIIGGFHCAGYHRDISCEVSGMVWSQPGYDPQQAAETCYRNVSEAMRKAGVPRRSRA